MSLPVVSLCALAVAVLVSFTARINVGVLSIVFAWVIGVYLGGLPLAEVLKGFPEQVFLTLAGVTLLFTQAQMNGTLDRISHYAVRGCRGNVGLIPIMFFFLSAVLASIGPGSMAMAAIIAPMAMRVAGRAKISAFLMTIMVGNGTNAGSLSPVAPAGSTVNVLLANIGITGVEWPNYFVILVAHAIVAFGGYFLFGGYRLFGRTFRESIDDVAPVDVEFHRQHWVTIGVIAGLMISVIVFGMNVGMAAFTGAILLILLKCSGEGDPLRQVPWSPIMMLSGVTILVELAEETGGINLFAALLAKVSTQESVTAMIAFVTGVISVYSSTSSVVLPAFIPMIPSLAEQVGGADPLSIAWSIFVGSHLVDISPLSTTGALCIASAPPTEDHRSLFKKLLAWGLCMSVVAAGISYVCFGLLR
jgi:Na+/H+ antiporter NhaD/arsenite permease-like protein